MKSTPCLPILDITDLTIFNQLVIYDIKRNLKSLERHPLIKELEDKIKHRVIYSMLVPKKESLEIYDEIINGSIPQEIIKYLILLYKRISKIHDPEKINLVAVLRSGLPLVLLLRYIIYKIHGKEIQVSAISPNYINQIDINPFKKHVGNLNKNIESIFIDGWCSEEVTYNIVKEFWNNLFPNKKFWYAVLSNLSPLEEKSLICATRKDILIPWSICQTDNLGLSNYFLHPTNKTSCAFVIPKNNREIKNSEPVYRKLIDRKIKDKIFLNKHYQKETKPEYLMPNKYDPGIIKLGINECIKSIDKKDDIKLYISNTPKNSYKILEKYAKINSVKYQYTSKKQSFVIRDFSQK